MSACRKLGMSDCPGDPMPANHPFVSLLVSLCAVPLLIAAPAPKTDPDLSLENPRTRLGSDRFRAAGEVTALVFSPDGSRLVALAANGMSVWDAATGRELRFVPWLYA